MSASERLNAAGTAYAEGTVVRPPRNGLSTLPTNEGSPLSASPFNTSANEEVKPERLQAEKARVAAIFNERVLPLLAEIDALAVGTKHEQTKRILEAFANGWRKLFDRNEHLLAADDRCLVTMEQAVVSLRETYQRHGDITTEDLNRRPAFYNLQNDLCNPGVSSVRDYLVPQTWTRLARKPQ